MKPSHRGWALAEVVGALVVLGIATGAVLSATFALADSAQERRAAASETAFSNVSCAWLRFGGALARDPASHPLASSVRGALPAAVPGAQVERGGLEIRAWSQAAVGRGAIARAWTLGPATRRAAPVRLAAPRFRYEGVIPDSAFPLRDILVPHPANPPGTLHRFTIDGTDPTSLSPVWNPATSYPLWPFPGEIRAAAFAPDGSRAPSSVASTLLRRRTRVRIARIDGNPSLCYTLADALAPPGQRGLRIWVDAAPPGTALRVTLDGSDPGLGAEVSGPVSVAPSTAAPWRPQLTVRARGFGPAQVEIEDAAVVLTPQRVALAAPTLRAPSGTVPSPATVGLETGPLPPRAEASTSVDGKAWTPCVGGSVVVPWQ